MQVKLFGLSDDTIKNNLYLYFFKWDTLTQTQFDKNNVIKVAHNSSKYHLEKYFKIIVPQTINP